LWYVLPESNKQYPLSIEMAVKIKAQNREGIKPEILESVEVVSGKPKEVEPEYADLVGQISLKSLERTTRKRRDKERSQQTRGQQQQGKRQGPQHPSQGMPPRDRDQGRPPQANRQSDRSPRDKGPQQRDQREQRGGGQPDRFNRRK